MNILLIIAELKSNEIYLWLEGDNLVFSFDERYGFPEELKNKVRSNKQLLLTLLSFNNVTSESIAKNLCYYRLGDLDKDMQLSDIQKGIYLQTKLDYLHNTYNITVLLKIYENINVEILKKTLKIILMKHKILRLAVQEDFSYKFFDVDEMSINYMEITRDYLEGYIQQQQDHKFIIEGSQLIKLELVKIVDDNVYVLNLTHHHIINDMYSVGLLVDEVLGLYWNLLNNNLDIIQTQSLGICDLNYFDFKAFQNSQLITPEYQESINILVDKLSACSPLQLNNISYKKLDNMGSSFQFNIDENVYKNIKHLSFKHNVSLYSVLVTCLYHALYLYDRSKNKFAIGLTVANRPYEFTKAIGPFISTLPLVFDFVVDEKLINSIKHCHNEIVHLNQYGFINLNRLVEQLTNRTLYKINELVQVMFTLHNFIEVDTTELQRNIKYDVILVKEKVERFGISVIARQKLNYLEFNISYASAIYTESEIREVFNCYQDLLYNISESVLQTQINHMLIGVNHSLMPENNLINSFDYKQSSKKYWMGVIGDMPLSISLPYKLEIDTKLLDNKLVELEYFEIDDINSCLLHEQAKKNDTKLFIILVAVYGVVLSRYANQEKVLINLPLNMRQKKYSESMDLNVANNVLLKIELDKCQALNELILNIVQQIRDIRAYGHCSLTDIIEDQRRHGNISGNLFNASFTSTDHNEMPMYLGDEDAEIIDILWNNDLEPELKLLYYVDANKIKFNLIYIKRLFDTHVIKAIIESFKSLLLKFANQQIILLADYCVLDQNTYMQVVNVWNGSISQCADNRTLFQLFEEQVLLTPENVAIIDGSQISYSYMELSIKSTLLATYLRQQVSNAELMAVLAEKGWYQVVSILAIMKAGFGYLPLHIEWPSGRLEEILETSMINQIVISREAFLRLDTIEQLSMNYKFLIIEDIFDNLNNSQNYQILEASILPEVSSDDIAYVIFTSGSTGKPKGVSISHSSAINTIQTVNSQYQITQSDKILALSELSFDLSVYDIFGLLMVGGTVVFPLQSRTKEALYWIELINNYQISLWNSVPQLAQLLVEELSVNELYLRSLRVVLLSGDWIPVNLPNQFANRCKFDCQIISLGGATECSIWSIWHKIDKVESSWRAIPYGLSMPNQQVYILDYSLNHCPIGVSGEIYIGGKGVALNYYNNNEMTRANFIEHHKLQRLYKTGDIGRWNIKGYIEYIGRNDFQVKVQGYRIELGEIEALLCSYPGVTQCVVLVKEQKKSSDNINDIKYLVAYYTKNIVIDENDTKGFINNWNSIYETNYRISLADNSEATSISGWKSSYTTDNISDKDMIEWVDSTVDRIKQLRPEVILEIGSGSGLILFNLLNNFNCYYATDFSVNAIEYINKRNYKCKQSGEIHSLVCAADQIPYDIFIKKCDTIIMNSVIQYFPNLAYFEQVINTAISNIKRSGQVFIGDVRDYRLLKCFHYSVQNYKSNSVTIDDVNYFSNHDKELLIAPEYFIWFSKQNNAITYVEIMPRNGSADNEMNKYRYDAILHVNKSDECLNIQSEVFVKVNDFVKYLNNNLLNSILYIKYLNKRILADYIGYNKIIGNAVNLHDYVLSMDEIINITAESGYKVKFYLDLEDELHFNIIIYKKDYLNSKFNINYFGNININYSDFANNPLINAKLLDTQDVQDMKQHLANVLPQYMIPTEYVLLPSFPLTAIGKLDRIALHGLGNVDTDGYAAPRNDLEQAVCNIYADILGLSISHVGIKHNFFRLGGNSILAIRLASKLNSDVLNALGFTVNVNEIFTYDTIVELLTHVVSRNDSEEEIIIPALDDVLH